MNAKWTITGEEELSVKYENLIDSTFFDCGTCKSNIEEAVAFILEEGGMVGDKVFLNEAFYCEILLNEKAQNVQQNRSFVS